MFDPTNVRQRAYALLLVMPLFFASNIVIGRAAAATVEPWTLAFLRWLVAFLILLPFALPGLKQHRDEILRNWRLITIMGLLGMWFCGAGVYFALRYTSATNGTLIYTSSPVLILMLEWLFRGRAIGRREAIGIVLAILGVVAIVVKGSLGQLLALRFNAGDVIFAIAALSWAVYSVLLKRKTLAAVPTISLFAALAFAGVVTLAPFTLVEIVETGHFPASLDAWLSIFGLALIASVLAFYCFQHGIAVVGPSTAGLFMYLLPPYGVIMAVVFLGEELHAYHFAGFLLIMSGLVMATAPVSLWRKAADLLPLGLLKLPLRAPAQGAE
ncbi:MULTISPECIES: DMT family transporter [unclassified Stappia]|uniref:DMT family transporter n=1 Tax=unclassified Stappia TaxID=2629676 RepID=UPI001645DFEC|nr:MULTISPECIES: DMT family transporter [unclassified Stappia]